MFSEAAKQRRRRGEGKIELCSNFDDVDAALLN